MEYRIQDLHQLPLVARLFRDEVLLAGKEKTKPKKFAFVGEMGIGKTTFILELIRQMGVSGVEGSPTYSLVNEYHSEKFGEIFHFDLYRIESEEEAFDIGIEEMIYADNAYCFIEWPERIHNLLTSEFVWVHFTRDEESGFRTLNVKS